MVALFAPSQLTRREPQTALGWDLDSPASVIAATGTLRDRIVAVALEQWKRWNRGRLKETESGAVSMLEGYWKVGVGRTVATAELRNFAWQSKNPWSAAFISWVMRNAGAGAAFKYSAAHRVYISAAKKNRLTNNLANPFWAYRISEAAPQLGDLVCQWRKSATGYDDVDDGKERATHCDVVVQVEPGKVSAIGGNVSIDRNVSQSVGMKVLYTNAKGFLDVARHPRAFAIVKLREAATPAVAGSPAVRVDDAVRKNRFYAASLGWGARIFDVQQALGFKDVSPDERLLAESVARWQATRGLSVDGVIGPRTWRALKAVLQPSSAASSPAPAGKLMTAYDIRRSVPHWSKPGNAGHWLEGGVHIKGKMKIGIPPGTAEPSDVVMATIAGVETSTYDGMNLYDRGILTWGISQWTLHADSLQKQLRIMKKERPAMFKRLFVDRGVDVGTRELEVVLQGKLCATREETRLAIKGDRNGRVKGDYTPWSEMAYARMEFWAKLFCDAARDPECQAYQRELAVRQYRTDILSASIDAWTKEKGYGRVPLYANRNLLLQAMLCGLYINNPVGSMKVMARTVDHFRRENGGQADPARWAPGWQNRIGQKYIELAATVGPSRGLTEWPNRIRMQRNAHDRVVGSRMLPGVAL